MPKLCSIYFSFCKNNYHILSVLFFFFFFSLAGIAQKNNISGIVRSKVSGESLPYANIMIKGTSVGTTTNVDGFFTLLNIPGDTLTLQVFYIGFIPKEVKVDFVSLPDNLLIELESGTTELQEVVVQSTNYRFVKTTEGVSQARIATRDISLLPSVGENDIFRSLQLLPGVSGTNESTSGLYIRGGTPDQNLVLLDGMTVYHVDHFFGFFSAFNADAIKDVKMYKGGFPAKYGGRTSGVVDLTGKTGDVNSFRLGAGINLLSSRLILEIPLWGKGSILLSGRRSYTDYLESGLYEKIFDMLTQGNESQDITIPDNPRFQNAETTTLEPTFYFYDLNGKISFRPTQKDNIALSVYNGQDYLNESRNLYREIKPKNPDFPVRAVTNNLSDLTDWGNMGGSFKWSRRWHPKFYTNFLSAYSMYFSKNNKRSEQEVRNPDADTIMVTRLQSNLEDNRVEDLTFRLDNEWQLTQNHKIDFGFIGTQAKVRFRFVRNDTSTMIDREQESISAGAYVQDTWKVLPGFEVIAGGRINYFEKTDSLYPEPRFSFSYELSDRIKLKGAYGHYHQFISRIVNENITEGSRDFWLLADGDWIKIGKERHYIGGISLENETYLLDFEMYYKEMEGLTEYSLRFKRNRGPSQLFFHGEGYARGLEILVQKKAGKYKGWISYTLSSVKHTFPDFNDGREFSALHDQMHELKIIQSYSLKKWSFSSTFVYGSGTPYTEPEGRYILTMLDDKELTYIGVGDKNGVRLPPYHRLDVATHYKFKLFGADCDLGFSIFNVYNHKNIWYRQFDFNESPMLVTEITYLGFTPNLSFYFEF